MGAKMQAYNARRAATKNMVSCSVCGTVFHRPPANAARNERQFCSKSCRNAGSVGDGNPKWRGGIIRDKDGRVMVYAPEHPNANLHGGTHIYRYRMVASYVLGRPLRDDEIVHHVNGDCTDDRPENLQVMTQSEHARLHDIPSLRRVPKVECVCLTCEAVFPKDRWRVKRGEGKYCSHRCANIALAPKLRAGHEEWRRRNESA